MYKVICQLLIRRYLLIQDLYFFIKLNKKTEISKKVCIIKLRAQLDILKIKSLINNVGLFFIMTFLETSCRRSAGLSGDHR